MSSELSPARPPSRPANLWIPSVALLFLLALLAPGFRKTNCGGNSAALHLCHLFAGEYALWASSQRDDHRTLNAWLGDAGVDLVRSTLPMAFLDSEDLRVIQPEAPADVVHPRPILVVRRAFTNQPEPLFWFTPFFRTPRHAVAFSNGTARLLTASELTSYSHLPAFGLAAR